MPGMVLPRGPRDQPAADVDYQTLAELRYLIRKFHRRREAAARRAGIQPQQHLLLLQLRGLPPGQPPTISTLAERLQIRHHSAVELVDRLVERGLVERRHEGPDRRVVTVVLRPAAETLLENLAQYSLAELQTEGPALVKALRELMEGAG
jgi:DNA-binding MarR family transcriptional regulator